MSGHRADFCSKCVDGAAVLGTLLVRHHDAVPDASWIPASGGMTVMSSLAAVFMYSILPQHHHRCIMKTLSFTMFSRVSEQTALLACEVPLPITRAFVVECGSGRLSWRGVHETVVSADQSTWTQTRAL